MDSILNQNNPAHILTLLLCVTYPDEMYLICVKRVRMSESGDVNSSSSNLRC
jgi:hypothetical protein